MAALAYPKFEPVFPCRMGSVQIQQKKPVVIPPSRTGAFPDFVKKAQTKARTTNASAAHETTTSNLGVQVASVKAREDSLPLKLAEVKRLTGWSWERVAQALGCTRQAIHGWTVGREINQNNAERLAKLYATILYIDRGSAEDNRALLNTDLGNGLIAAELIDQGRFEELRTFAGEGGHSRDVTPWSRLADEELSVAREHWFDRLAQVGASGASFEIVPAAGEKRRLTVRRLDK